LRERHGSDTVRAVSDGPARSQVPRSPQLPGASGAWTKGWETADAAVRELSRRHTRRFGRLVWAPVFVGVPPANVP
jgi:hypothetical protein